MLIWVNGTFGVGKTQVAYELARRTPGAVVCDPEVIGYGLHQCLPPTLRGDFQDLASWRVGVVDTLDLTVREHSGPVIVPMTVTNSQYFDETVGRLIETDHVVRHFTLMASAETITGRLCTRGLGAGAIASRVGLRSWSLRREAWALGRLRENLEALQDEKFSDHLSTDDLPVSAVAERIAQSVSIELAPRSHRPSAALSRARVTLQHRRR